MEFLPGISFRNKRMLKYLAFLLLLSYLFAPPAFQAVLIPVQVPAQFPALRAGRFRRALGYQLRPRIPAQRPAAVQHVDLRAGHNPTNLIEHFVEHNA